MAKEGFKIARIQMDRVKGEVTAVDYRYVGVEEERKSNRSARPSSQKQWDWGDRWYPEGNRGS